MMMLSTINSFHTAENTNPVPLLAKIVSSKGYYYNKKTDDDDDDDNDDDHNRRFRIGVVYLHGFPDMSVHPTTGDFASRVPRKLCEAVTKRFDEEEVVFVCFNFSGLPGSDTTINFEQKTISREVLDAEAVVRYVIKELLLVPEAGGGGGGSVHVVGLSTGAIIASLLRNKDFGAKTTVTLTCIAGLLDIQAGSKLDFSPEQIQDFDQKGYCMKEFWIPPGCPIPDGDEDTVVVVQQPETPSQSTKILLKLNSEYFHEMTTTTSSSGGLLDIKASVHSGKAPLLVIHGTHDIHVPIEHGKQLFEAASEPKSFFEIEKGSHLLSNSSHMKKATSRIIQFIQEHA